MELKTRLQRGETVTGIMLSELSTPNIARLLGRCGCDFLLVDCEHGYFDFTQVANLTAVAEGAGLPVIVRLAQGCQSSIGKYLDMGVRGILLADTTGAAQARELSSACLYAPLGSRGISTFRAHTGYDSGDAVGHMEEANRRSLVIAQIESPEAAEEIDAILETEGLSGVLVGPNDLTQHMGIFGRTDREEVRSLLRSIAQAADRHGKWSGIITANEELIRFCAEAGMRCFSSGSELSMLAEGCRNKLDEVRRIVGGTQPGTVIYNRGENHEPN